MTRNELATGFAIDGVSRWILRKKWRSKWEFPMASRAEVRTRFKKEGIEFILVQFVDVTGAAKVKMMPASSLDEAIDTGAGFAGAALWGMGQGPHSHDLMARIDLDTYTRISWQPNMVRFASDLFVDGEPHPFCPRTNLQRMLGEAGKLGLKFNVGMEPEHFLVTRKADGSIEPWNPDGVDTLVKPCYDYRAMAPAMAYLQQLTKALNELGWNVYQCDHEDANGQFEVNFDYSDVLTTCDRITYFKMATSQIAKQFGAIATHMAKPFGDRTGSGLHAHYHMADAKTGQNVFVDKKDKRGLGCSKLAYHFLGGVLKHARALCAVSSPTVNCYKRLQIGAGLFSSRSGFLWTPAFITYGDNNRTQMIRTAGPGHFEDRTVSAGANPYLAMAAYLGAGLDGIKNQIDPGEPNLGNMYVKTLEEIRAKGIALLPQSLWEAVEELQRDEVIKAALGPIARAFIDLKVKEWETYHQHVTAWEVNQYLTYF